MTDHLADSLRAVFDDLVASAPRPGVRPSGPPPRASGGERRWLAAAVAAAVVLIIGGLVGLGEWRSGVSDETPAVTGPPVVPDEPSLLEPAPGDDLAVTARAPSDGSADPAGAVVAPNGAVFGLTLFAGAVMDDVELPDSYDERLIAGRTVGGFVDGSAPTQIYRGVGVECAIVGVNSAGEAMWSPDTEQLISSLGLAGDTVTVSLPSGWTSLGVNNDSVVFRSTLATRGDGDATTLSLWQSLDAPIGGFLASFETNPIEVVTADGPVLHVQSATTPTYNTIVGERFGTTFRLNGEAPLDDLVAVLDRLVPVAPDAWFDAPVDRQETSETPATMATEDGDADDCEIDTLAISDPLGQDAPVAVDEWSIGIPMFDVSITTIDGVATIDRGRLDGVRPGMPIVGSVAAPTDHMSGLLGVVADVNESTATISTLDTPGFSMMVDVDGVDVGLRLVTNDDGNLTVESPFVLEDDVAGASVTAPRGHRLAAVHIPVGVVTALDRAGTVLQIAPLASPTGAENTGVFLVE